MRAYARAAASGHSTVAKPESSDAERSEAGRGDAAAAAAGASASPAGVWLARAPKVRVDSIVGAGDAFVGGFLCGWAAGRPLVEAFRLGIASGTATAMTPGTELCHRADVRRLLPRVTITQVA